jgi:hypothetical protein
LEVVAEGKVTIQETLSSSATDVQQFGGGQLGEFLPREFLVAKISSNQASVSLTDSNKGFARSIMTCDRDVETLVRLAVTKNGNVDHVIADCQLPIVDLCPICFSLSLPEVLSRRFTRKNADWNKKNLRKRVYVCLICVYLRKSAAQPTPINDKLKHIGH